MNAPFTPVDNYADLGALLRLLVDPAATKQRLDELVAQQEATKAEIATLNAMAADTRRLNTTAQATTIVLQRREAAFSAREAEADDREAKIAQVEGTQSEAARRHRDNAAEAKENAVARREAAVAKREAAVEKREAKIRTAIEE